MVDAKRKIYSPHAQIQEYNNENFWEHHQNIPLWDSGQGRERAA